MGRWAGGWVDEWVGVSVQPRLIVARLGLLTGVTGTISSRQRMREREDSNSEKDARADRGSKPNERPPYFTPLGKDQRSSRVHSNQPLALMNPHGFPIQPQFP